MKHGLTLGRFALILGAWTLATSEASADQFHYNNVTIGTRAVGMGGAFTGVADDASGVFYNPAGLAFALSNDISGSANAYYQKTSTYKGAICGEDFTETSGGSVPSFFGGLQKLDRYVEGLVFAFGAYSTDSDLKDQDTLLKNRTEGCGARPIESYHRASNARANTYYAGAAVGKRVGSRIAWGLGVSYVNVDELVQEYQDFKQVRGLDNAGTLGWTVYSGNVRQHLEVFGAQPVFGVQAALPGNVAVGLTFKKGIVASQRLQVDSETQTNILSNDQKAASDASASGASDSLITAKSNLRAKSSKPIGNLPAEIRVGFAWFASPTLLLTTDIVHHTAVTDADVIKDDKGLAIFGTRALYAKEAVTDYALGAEYYVMASIPLRLGLFTNNDARPKINKVDAAAFDVSKVCSNVDTHAKYCDQPDHVDYLGETLFIAWVQPNSQVATRQGRSSKSRR